MKIEIRLKDQIGISQKVLTVVANYGWNLIAMEVKIGFIYLHLEGGSQTLLEIENALSRVISIIQCSEIEVMPSQLKENHLQALLSRITQPIIDIDQHGVVININQAAKVLFKNQSLLEQHIEQILPISAKDYQAKRGHSISVNIKRQSFIADITTVFSEKDYQGAVIMLRETKALGQELSALQKTEQLDEGIAAILSQSDSMAAIKQQAHRFAGLDLPVIVQGETGTGKELLARAMHESSSRANNPFLAINCATIPENLLESELFGYQAGAFTGAQKGGKPGLFELAEGGTVFLDEIAEMSVYLQAKLLRFLENYQYRRVGGTQELNANVRIISATHQDLNQLIKQGIFREDLYYRLNVLSITIPPLRERLADLTVLIPHFMQLAAKQVDLAQPVITELGYKKLASYRWPGNVRQLQNSLFRLVALAQTHVITELEIGHVLTELGQDNIEKNDQLKGADYTEVENWQQAQQNFEINLLSQLLPFYPSTRALAKRLGVSHNKIAMKLRQHKLP